MVLRIQIKASSYGMPGRVVAVESGQVVWAGSIKDLGEAVNFDTLFCHEDDEQRLIGLVCAKNLTPVPDNQRV